MADMRPQTVTRRKAQARQSLFKVQGILPESCSQMIILLENLKPSMATWDPPPLTASSSIESGGPANGTPAVPKMGWSKGVWSGLLKRDCSKELTCKTLWESRSQTSYESVASIIHNGQNDGSDGQQEEPPI